VVAHHHEHGAVNYDRAFAIGVGLNVAIVAVQIGLGIVAGSLALLADAGHNLSDVLGLVLAWGAAVLSRRAPTTYRTYGWRRSSILAALANALLLILVTGGIAWEAIRRLADPSPVEGEIVIWAAAIAALVNGGAALLFLKGRAEDINLRGAFLHLATDAAVSLGVAFTGVAILLTGWLWLDPAVSLTISAVILLSTWSLLRAATNLVMDAVPDAVDIQQVRAYLAGLPEVVGFHDLHVWAMSTTETALTVHLVLVGDGLNDALLDEICGELRHDFGIAHATIQLEACEQEHVCSLEFPHVPAAPGHSAHAH
jgi:cobalt-zinc-cadmium efflux system protein